MQNEEEKPFEMTPEKAAEIMLQQPIGLPDSYFQKEYKPDRRDYFAAAALTGLLANPEYLKWIKESNLPDMNGMYSMEAIDHADDIIKRLNETK
jgi:hypothetical protein